MIEWLWIYVRYTGAMAAVLALLVLALVLPWWFHAALAALFLGAVILGLGLGAGRSWARRLDRLLFWPRSAARERE